MFFSDEDCELFNEENKYSLDKKSVKSVKFSIKNYADYTVNYTSIQADLH